MKPATPLPWKRGYSDGSGPEYATASTAKEDDKAVLAASWGCDCCKSQLTKEKQQDLDFAIHAANMHGRLVEFLQRFAGLLEEGAKHLPQIDESAIAKEARALLAEAEGRKA